MWITGRCARTIPSADSVDACDGKLNARRSIRFEIDPSVYNFTQFRAYFLNLNHLRVVP